MFSCGIEPIPSIIVNISVFKSKQYQQCQFKRVVSLTSELLIKIGGIASIPKGDGIDLAPEGRLSF